MQRNMITATENLTEELKGKQEFSSGGVFLFAFKSYSRLLIQRDSLGGVTVAPQFLLLHL